MFFQELWALRFTLPAEDLQKLAARAASLAAAHGALAVDHTVSFGRYNAQAAELRALAAMRIHKAAGEEA